MHGRDAEDVVVGDEEIGAGPVDPPVGADDAVEGQEDDPVHGGGGVEVGEEEVDVAAIHVRGRVRGLRADPPEDEARGHAAAHGGGGPAPAPLPVEAEEVGVGVHDGPAGGDGRHGPGRAPRP